MYRYISVGLAACVCAFCSLVGIAESRAQSYTLKVETCVEQGEQYVCEFDNGAKVPLSRDDYLKAKAYAAQGGDLTVSPNSTPRASGEEQANAPQRKGTYVPGSAQKELESDPEQYAQGLKLFDELIALDAKGWMFNRYNRGSVRNLKIVEESEDGTQRVVYAEYLFNGSRKGHVRVLFADGALKCMKYWDSPSCRPIGRSHSQAFAAAVAAGMARSMISPGPSSGSGSGSCETGYFVDSVTGAQRTIQRC